MSYQNLILGNEFSKPTQDLKVNTINCESMECVTHVIDDLFVQTITADAPATEITVNDNMHFLGDIEVDGNIIGNMTDDDIVVNTIEAKDFTFVEMINDTVFDQKIKITDSDTSSSNTQFHSKSLGENTLWVEASSNN